MVSIAATSLSKPPKVLMGADGGTATLADYKAFVERQKDPLRGVGLTTLSRSAVVSQIAWNHDGQRLAIAVNDGTVLSYTFDDKDASSSVSPMVVPLLPIVGTT